MVGSLARIPREVGVHSPLKQSCRVYALHVMPNLPAGCSPIYRAHNGRVSRMHSARGWHPFPAQAGSSGITAGRRAKPSSVLLFDNRSGMLINESVRYKRDSEYHSLPPPARSWHPSPPQAACRAYALDVLRNLPASLFFDNRTGMLTSTTASATMGIPTVIAPPPRPRCRLQLPRAEALFVARDLTWRRQRHLIRITGGHPNTS